MLRIERFISTIDRPKYGLFFYYIVAVLFFWNTTGTSFVDDSLEWIVSYMKQGWRGYMHSYDMTSVYYLHDLFSNLMYDSFGKNNVLWYIIILFFHSSACYYLYKYIYLILSDNDRKNARWIAIVSSFIFLCGAYNTENIFWIATYHYEVSIFYLFVSLFKIAEQKGELTKRQYWYIFGVFPFMLTMHEISFFFPIAFFATIVYYQWNMVRLKLKNWIAFLIPYGIAGFVVLIMTKIVKGSFIPHYGVSHVKDHNLYNFFYTLYCYIAKHFLFIHNLEFRLREKIYDVDIKTMIILFIGILFLILATIYVLRKRLYKMKDYYLIIFLLLLFYLPVSNMYFFWHFPIQNDRLGYYLSAFAFVLFSIWSISNLGQIGKLITVLFMLANLFFFRINIHNIEESIYFTEKIAVNSYKPYLDKCPIILNLPYNYKGFYSFRKIFRFESSMYFYFQKDIKFIYTTSMPFFSPTDSVETEKLSDSTYKIRLRAPGAWLMKESLGGLDYQNDQVKVDYSDDNQEATILIKNFNNNPILYCTGNRGFVELK